MNSRSPSQDRSSGYAHRPHYRIDLLRRPNRITVHANGRELASSDQTILMDEQDHALVVYFPRADVDMPSLVPVTGYSSHCPFKGDACYWALSEMPGEPIGWSYTSPYAEVATIAGYIAFDQDLVEVRLSTGAG